MSSSDSIPWEIWGAILVRLPAECLTRARAVSKGFRAVIDDPWFVRAHTNNLQQQQKLSSSSKITFQRKLTPLSTHDICYSLDLEALITTSSSKQAIIPATPLDHLNIFSDTLYGLALPVGECDGLLLTAQKPAFAIWNLLTRERLDLPDSSFSYDLLWSFGLGYDGATDDYKAVAILRSRETHVYSLKSDSWRSIIDCCPPSCMGDWPGRLDPGVFVHGSLFWLSRKKGPGAYNDNKIVALDLGTEKYSMLQMPPQTRRAKYHSMLLYVLGGRLVLSDCGDHGYETHSDVWVMKKKDSWIKLFSLDWERNVTQWRRDLRPVAFVMKEKLLVLQSWGGCFFLFDVETKSLKPGKIDGLIFGNGWWDLYAKQTFVGTIFRLHASCGGGGVRRKIIATSSSKKAAADQLVFSVGDTLIVKEGSCFCPVKNEYV